MRGSPGISTPVVLRDFGADSEISEAREQHGIPSGRLESSTGLIP
jgi:hypothetical protein